MHPTWQYARARNIVDDDIGIYDEHFARSPPLSSLDVKSAETTLPEMPLGEFFYHILLCVQHEKYSKA